MGLNGHPHEQHAILPSMKEQNASKNLAKSLQSYVLRISAGISFFAATLAFISYLFFPSSLEEAYQFAVYFLGGLSYLIGAPGLLLVLFGKAKNRALNFGVYLISFLALTILALLFLGLLQDAAGVRCYIFWDWSPSACIDTMRFYIFIVLFYPFVFIPLAIAIISIFANGLLKFYRSRGLKK